MPKERNMLSLLPKLRSKDLVNWVKWAACEGNAWETYPISKVAFASRVSVRKFLCSYANQHSALQNNCTAIRICQLVDLIDEEDAKDDEANAGDFLADYPS